MFLMLSLYAMTGSSAEPEYGVGVDPMKISLTPGRMSYFTVLNETERDYVVTTRVVSDSPSYSDGEKVDDRFFVNPPLRLLKKRDRTRMGVVYLKSGKPITPDLKYYLSVSFIPKVSEDRAKLSVPVILVQQIPLTFG